MAAKDDRRKTAAGKARDPDLSNLYKGKELQPIWDPSDFRMTLRGTRNEYGDLSAAVESFSWADEESTLTGSITLRTASIPLGMPKVEEGFAIECAIRYGGPLAPSAGFINLWRMRAAAPDEDESEGTLTFELADEFDALRRGRRDFIYKKTARHQHGWFYHEIVRDVCRRAGVRVGLLRAGKERIDKLVKKNANPLDVIRAAVAEEQDATGYQMVIRMRNGLLEIDRFKRNPKLYVVESRFQSSVGTEAGRTDKVTVLEGIGRIGSGKGARKVRFQAYDKAVVDRLGYVHREKNYHRVRSLADLRNRVRRDLAKLLRTYKTGTVSFPGLPFVYRGETHRLVLPRLSGDDQYVFLDAVRHTVDDSFVTEVDYTTQDKFLRPLAEQEKDVRAERRKARERRKSK